jgi:hypothetical protein
MAMDHGLRRRTGWADGLDLLWYGEIELFCLRLVVYNAFMESCRLLTLFNTFSRACGIELQGARALHQSESFRLPTQGLDTRPTWPIEHAYSLSYLLQYSHVVAISVRSLLPL